MGQGWHWVAGVRVVDERAEKSRGERFLGREKRRVKGMDIDWKGIYLIYAKTKTVDREVGKTKTRDIQYIRR